MPQARSVKTSVCPDCGASISGGVCTPCAFGSLLTPGLVPLVEAKRAEDGSVPNLDMEFGSYVLRRRLASGGMGVVYIAEHRDLKREVALKMIRGSSFANELERSRFMVEAEAAAGLDHANIVPIYEVGVVEEQPFFTMKLIRGTSLAELLQSEKKPELRQLIEWLEQIAQAVSHAHSHGVLHRDLKPGNVLIDEGGKPWLMDFGLAKLADSDNELTRETDRVGTPNYMSPEVVTGTAGAVSVLSDVWALGVILWQALTGDLPFKGSGAVEILRKIAEEEPVRPIEVVDRDLLTLASRCMEKDPARRVVSAGEFANELRRWQCGEPLRVRRVTTAERLIKWVRRKPAVAACYAILAVGGVSSMVLWQRAEKAVGSLTESNQQLGQALAVSMSTKLAVEARIQINENPARALLLAVEAVEQTESLLGATMPEAVESLYATLQEIGGQSAAPDREVHRFENLTYFSHGVASELPPLFSPDSKKLLTVDYVNVPSRGVWAAVSDLDAPVGAEFEYSWQLSETLGGVKSIEWAADSKALVVLDPDSSVQWWDLGEVPGRSTLGSLNRDGMRLAVVKFLPQENGDLHGIGAYQANEGEGVYVGEFRAKRSEGMAIELCDLKRLPVPGLALHTALTISKQNQWLYAWNHTGGWLVHLNEEGNHCRVSDASQEIGMVQFCPNEKWVGLRQKTNDVIVHDLRSGSAVEAGASKRKILTHRDWVHTIEFSPDSEWVAVAGQSDSLVLVPLGETTEWVRHLRLPRSKFLGVRYSPDGKWIGAGSMDKMVTIWPAKWQGAEPAPLRLKGLTTPVLDVHFSADGRSFAATGLNSAYWRWNLQSNRDGAQPMVLGQASENRRIEDIAVSPDQKWLVAGVANSGEVNLMSADGSGEWLLGVHEGGATGVAFDRDGGWVASGGVDGTVKVWDLRAVIAAIWEGSVPPPPRHVLDVSDARIEYVRKIAFHPRGVLYSTCGDGLLFEWDMNAEDPGLDRKAYLLHSISFMLPDVQVSPDGKWLALGRHGNDPTPEPGETQYGNMVLLFDVQKPGQPVPVAELPAAFAGKTNIEFSRDSRWMVAGNDGVGSMVWDLEAKSIEASRLIAPEGAQNMPGVAFLGDGKTLVLGGSDGRIHLWEWQTSARPRTIATGRAVESLVWLGESQFASAGEGGQVQIWETDLERLKQLAKTVAGRELTKEERRRFRIP